jgi:hypothetical protein
MAATPVEHIPEKLFDFLDKNMDKYKDLACPHSLPCLSVELNARRQVASPPLPASAENASKTASPSASATNQPDDEEE